MITFSQPTSTNELLEKLALQYGKQTAPKVGAFGRIMAPLTGIGSILDAYHDARYEQQNANLGNVLKNYGINLAQGVGTLATGTRYENVEGASELLDKMNPSWQYSGLGKSTIGRIGVDIAAGLVTDPTTYFGFKGISLADDAVKAGSEALKKLGVVDDVIESLVPRLLGGTLKDATKVIAGSIGDDAANVFSKAIIRKIGKGASRGGALNLFGKTITENPKAVLAAKALISPLSAGLEVGGEASKRFTPRLRENVLDMFSKTQVLEEAGKGDLADLLVRRDRESDNIYRSVMGNLQSAELVEKMDKLSDVDRKQINDLIEATRESIYTGDVAESLYKEKDSVVDALEDFFIKQPNELNSPYPEGLFGGSQTVHQPSFDMLQGGQEAVEEIANKGASELDSLLASLDPDQSEVLTGLISRVDSTATEGMSRSSLEDIFEDFFGNYSNADGSLKVPEGISEEAKEYLSKYFKWDKQQAGRLERAGFPVLDAKERGYVSRYATGYDKGRFVKILKEAGYNDVRIEDILAKNTVKKSFEESGNISRKLTEKITDSDVSNILKRYDTGGIGSELSGQGAVKGRVYETLKEAREAGFVYGADPMESLFKQTVRQEKQLINRTFMNDMARTVDMDGERMFYEKANRNFQTPIIIPEYGTLYTDGHTAKAVEDYVSKYTTEDGMDKLLEGFDDAQKFWKKTVTGMGPNMVAYQTRNLIDDNFRMVIKGDNPLQLTRNYKLAHEVVQFDKLVNSVGIDEARRTFDTGYIDKYLKGAGFGFEESKNSVEEVWNIINKKAVWSDVSKMTSETGMDIPTKLAKDLSLEMTNMEKAEHAASLGGRLPMREQYSRMAHFFSQWEKTGSTDRAVESVKEVLFNYNELTKVERDMFKRIIPFYGFVKNNLEFYLNTMKDNPEKLSRFMNVYEGIQTGSQSKYQEEYDLLPEYLKDTLTVPVGKKGGELQYLTGLNMSAEGLGDLPIGAKGLQNMTGNLSPALNIALERISGKDLFRGEDIANINTAYAHQNRSDLFKKLTGFREYEVTPEGGEKFSKATMSPEARYWLDALPVLSTFDMTTRQVADAFAGENILKNLTNKVLPVKMRDSKIGDIQDRTARKREEDLYKLLQKKGIAEVYNSFYIPSGLKEELLK